MTEYRGYIVNCWHRFPEFDIHNTPFLGRITGDLGRYWELVHLDKGYTVKALKAACSTKPCKNLMETQDKDKQKDYTPAESAPTTRALKALLDF